MQEGVTEAMQGMLGICEAGPQQGKPPQPLPDASGTQQSPSGATDDPESTEKAAEHAIQAAWLEFQERLGEGMKVTQSALPLTLFKFAVYRSPFR